MRMEVIMTVVSATVLLIRIDISKFYKEVSLMGLYRADR